MDTLVIFIFLIWNGYQLSVVTLPTSISPAVLCFLASIKINECLLIDDFRSRKLFYFKKKRILSITRNFFLYYFSFKITELNEKLMSTNRICLLSLNHPTFPILFQELLNIRYRLCLCTHLHIGYLAPVVLSRKI